MISLNKKLIKIKDSNENEDNLIKFLKNLRPNSKENNKIKFYLENISFDLLNFSSGINLLCESILNEEKIAILGDYDVDGTISTSLFVIYFKYLKNFFNFSYIYHIPNRFKEGYGLSKFIINKFIEEKVNLIITVDNGTTAYEEILLAKNHKIKTLILDHHRINEKIPPATCFINSQNSKNYNYLCGGGLVFVFLIEFQKELLKKKFFPKKNFYDLIELAAIATICDFVPLKNLNRLIVKEGIKKINFLFYKKENKLNMSIYNILYYNFYHFNENSYISTSDIAYIIGPFLNAAGRIEDGNLIVEFLISNEKKNIEIIFLKIQQLLFERKKIQESILNSFQEKDIYEKHIFFFNKNIHEGVMGIIAAKLKEKYYKTTFVITQNEEICKGSIRSVFPFNAGIFIEKAIENNLLIKGGGHEMAGGFSLYEHEIKNFENFTLNYMNHISYKMEETIFVDSVLCLSDLKKDFFFSLKEIGPFGIDNEEYIFMFPYLEIKNIFILKNKHVSITFSSIKNISIKGIWFFVEENIFKLLEKQKFFSVIGTLKYVSNNLEIHIIDMISL